MKFYNRYYKSNFEELITYYPRYYRDVFEMVAILKAFGQITETLEDHIEQAYLNNFVMQADEYTVGIWERILQITGTAELSLYQRKCAIIARLNSGAHVGEPEIREIISNYTDNAVSVDFARGIITIIIDGYVFGEEILLDTLLRRIPAHLALKMSIHIRKQYRQTILFAQAALTAHFFTGAPPTPEETIRTALPFSHGGEIGSNLAGDTPTPEETMRMRYKFWQGGTSISGSAGDTPQVQRAADGPVSVAQAAFDRPGISTDTPTVKGAATGREKTAGGLFCHTHIKSKRID